MFKFLEQANQIKQLKEQLNIARGTLDNLIQRYRELKTLQEEQLELLNQTTKANRILASKLQQIELAINNPNINSIDTIAQVINNENF